MHPEQQQQKRSVSELDWELENLRVSARIALEAAWAETEKIQQENTRYAKQIASLECIANQILKKEEESGEDRSSQRKTRPPQTVGKRELCRANSQPVIGRLPRQVFRRFSSMRDCNVSAESETPPPHLRSQGSLQKLFGFGWINQQTELEENLMNQLACLQEDMKSSMDELQIKLQKKEAAIKTLEHTLTLRDETLASLRAELTSVQQKRSLSLAISP